MHGGNRRAPVSQPAVSVRVLEMRAEHRCRIHLVGLAHHEFDTHPLCARRHDCHHLWMHGYVDEECGSLALREAPDHRHRFGGRRGLVEERRICHRQAGEIDHHLLEVEQRLQPPLGNLGLVGRVGGVPARVLEHVALDHRGRVRAVIAHADVVAPDLVVERMRAQLSSGGKLGGRLAEGQWLAQPDARRHHLLDQRIDGLNAECGEHLALLGLVGAEMAASEVVAAKERGELAHTPAALAYSALAMSSPSSALSLILTLKSQPESYGDSLTCSGCALRSWFAATISPDAGA